MNGHSLPAALLLVLPFRRSRLRQFLRCAGGRGFAGFRSLAASPHSRILPPASSPASPSRCCRLRQFHCCAGGGVRRWMAPGTAGLPCGGGRVVSYSTLRLRHSSPCGLVTRANAGGLRLLVLSFMARLGTSLSPGQSPHIFLGNVWRRSASLQSGPARSFLSATQGLIFVAGCRGCGCDDAGWAPAALLRPQADNGGGRHLGSPAPPVLYYFRPGSPRCPASQL